MAEKTMRIVFAGGGTGGHIYPGIAVADALALEAKEAGIALEIFWIGNKAGMDKTIVESQLVSKGKNITAFFGIPCGKLRRYFSLQNVVDAFKIIGGFFASVRILKKLKPDCLFSKGGFVSVPPCKAAKLLHIPYYTHECDFTPGLATKLNSSGAHAILLSYEDTKRFFSASLSSRCIVTGNPVRPVFYQKASISAADFLGIPQNHTKPALLVMGGSLGAKQINDLVVQNLSWLKERFIVVHQMGRAFAKENDWLFEQPAKDDSYRPFDFIYEEMPSVIQFSDVVLSRAGANSLWECAVCARPMLLIPLSGSGTRGDQVDNAEYFAKQNAALVLSGSDVTDKNVQQKLTELLSLEKRTELSSSCAALCKNIEQPAQKIAKIILQEKGSQK